MNRFAFQLRELVLCIFLMFTVFTASVVSQAVASGVNCTVGTADDTQGGDAALRRCESASSQLLVTSAATAVVVPPELKAQAESDD